MINVFLLRNMKRKAASKYFEECHFDIDAIGMKRVMSSESRWRVIYRKKGVLGLRDTCIRNVWIGLKRVTLEEKYPRLGAEWGLLKAENELLKKMKGGREGNNVPPSQNYLLIRSALKKYGEPLM